MSWVSLIVVVVGLSIGIAYLWYIRKKAQQEWWAACHTMASILVSVIVGLGIGFVVFQWEKEVGRQAEREDLLRLVYNELGVIEMDLAIGGRDTLIMKDTSVIAQLTVLPSSIILRAGASGVFTDVQSWRMFSLGAQIDKHNIYVEYLMGLLTQNIYSPSGEKKVLHAHGRISKNQGHILTNCNLLRMELGIEKNKYAENMKSKYGR